MPVYVNHDQIASSYTESFESGFGSWTTGANGWTRNSGGTPSSDTGPSAAHDGSYYVYVETTNGDGNYNAGDEAILELDQQASGISGWMHKYGRDQGTLYLEGWDGSAWVQIQSLTGDVGNSWFSFSETFSVTYDKIRFRNVAAGGYMGDVALDLLEVNSPGGLFWKEPTEISVRDSGLWKDVVWGYLKDQGVWKPFFAPAINDVAYLLQALNDNTSTGSPVTFDLGGSVQAEDSLILAICYESAGASTGVSLDAVTLDGQDVSLDVNETPVDNSNAVIASVPCNNISLSGNISLILSYSIDASSISRVGVGVFRVPGGLNQGIVDIGRSESPDSSGESVFVDFSKGVLVAAYYTGEDQQHSISGVDGSTELNFQYSGSGEGTVAHANSAGSDTYQVSTSHTETTNGQGAVLAVGVYR